MDRVELGIKLEQINKLRDKGDYAGASKVTDSIDWRKVKKWSELAVAEDVYEKAGRLKDARNICVYAYNRNLGGKRLIYKLAELSILINDLDEADDLYNEFIEAAPHDMERYVLLYMLNKARKAPTERLIQILEEYKQSELDEQYEYELASLYAEAGRIEECIRECDDLILWFNEGEYVEKALRLKAKYASLTKSQKAKLEMMEEYRAAGMEYSSLMPEYDNEPDDEAYSEQYSQPENKETLAAVETQPEPVEEYRVPEKDYSIYDTQNVQAELAKSMALILAGINGQEPDGDKIEEERLDHVGAGDGFAENMEEAGGLSDSIQEEAATEEDGLAEQFAEPQWENAEEPQPELSEEQQLAQEFVMAQIEALDSEQATTEELYREMEHKEDACDEVDEPTKEIRINTHHWKRYKSVMVEEEQEIPSAKEAAAPVVPGALPKYIVEESVIEAEADTEPQFIIEDIETIIGTHADEEHVHAEDNAEDNAAEAVNGGEDELTIQDEDMLFEKAYEEVPEELTEETEAESEEEITEEPSEETEAESEEEITEEPSEETEAESEEIPEEPSEETEAESDENLTDKNVPEGHTLTETPYLSAPAIVAAESAVSAGQNNTEQPIDGQIDLMQWLDAVGDTECADKTQTQTNEQDIPEEEQTEADAKDVSEEQTEADAKDVSEEQTEADAKDVSEEQTEADAKDASEEEQSAAQQPTEEELVDAAMNEIANQLMEEVAAELEEKERQEAPTAILEEEYADEELSEEAPYEETSGEAMYGEASEEMPYGETAGENHIADKGNEETAEKAVDDENDGEQEYSEKPEDEGNDYVLKSSERKYLQKYLFINRIEENAAEIINRKKREIPDGTSAHGNIVVIGKAKTNKTEFAIDLFKAIHSEDKNTKLRVAKTNAAVINNKGILASADKIKGATLIIENIGQLTKAAAKELSELMSSDTDSMLVIATGEDYAVNRVFAENPKLAEMFSYKIEVRRYSVNELVTAAKEHARANGYIIGEKALLKLYLLVGEIDSSDGAAALSKSKEIVDNAIEHSRKKRRGRHGKKSGNGVQLKEKDFI